MSAASTRVSHSCGIIRRNGQPVYFTRRHGKPDDEKPLPAKMPSTNGGPISWRFTYHDNGDITVSTQLTTATWNLKEDGDYILCEIIEWSGRRPTTARYRLYHQSMMLRETTAIA